MRTLLFTPGNRADLVEKALRSGADAVIVDLEDAVPGDAKEDARGGLAGLPEAGAPVYVRVNAPDTELLWDDVVAAGTAGVAGLVLPKAEDPDVIRRIDGALSALEVAAGRPRGLTRIVPLIESARGVMVAGELLAASARIDAVMVGSGERGDLVADLGCEWTSDGTALLHARSHVLLAARAAGIDQPVDGVFMDFKNLDGLRAECTLARRLGYVGKAAIHPAQIPVIHEVFTPGTEEVDRSRRILEAFEDALAQGSASIDFEGQMVDYAVARLARNVIARAHVDETTS